MADDPVASGSTASADAQADSPVSPWSQATVPLLPLLAAAVLVRFVHAWSALWWVGALLGGVGLVFTVLAVGEIVRGGRRRWFSVLPVLLSFSVIVRFIESV